MGVPVHVPTPIAREIIVNKHVAAPYNVAVPRAVPVAAPYKVHPVQEIVETRHLHHSLCPEGCHSRPHSSPRCLPRGCRCPEVCCACRLCRCWTRCCHRPCLCCWCSRLCCCPCCLCCCPCCLCRCLCCCTCCLCCCPCCS